MEPQKRTLIGGACGGGGGGGGVCTTGAAGGAGGAGGTTTAKTSRFAASMFMRGSALGNGVHTTDKGSRETFVAASFCDPRTASSALLCSRTRGSTPLTIFGVPSVHSAMMLNALVAPKVHNKL